MLLLFLLLVSESILTVLFLLHQRHVLQHLLVDHHHHVLSMFLTILILQHLLLYKLHNHFGSEQQFSDGMNFLQQKVKYLLLLPRLVPIGHYSYN